MAKRSNSMPIRSRRVVGQGGVGVVVFDHERAAAGAKSMWARFAERMHRPSARTIAVSEVMTSPVTCISCDLGVEAAAALFLDEQIGALPVVDNEGQPIGILTKSDLMRSGIADPRFPRIAITDLMTPVVTTLHENDNLARAASLMLEQRLHHLPVVDDDSGVVGILSTFDFARWIALGPGLL